MLTSRDKAIIKDLNRFRVMDRDSIAEIHFSNVKNPKDSTNHVLLRLLRDGHIQRSKSFVPYVYFGTDVNMKRNSAKVGHFLAILNTYKEMRRLGKLTTFLVEPKYGSKGTVEPDIFCIFRDTPFFIEVQRTLYSEKQMNEKINRYVELYHSNVMSKPFPHVLILSEQRYAIDMDLPFRLFQAQSFTQFLQSLKPEQPVIQNNTGTNLKLKING
ncbi:replication-relaxation family protein [Bacillus sp. EB600]|uniref:replication-relaxation family protein n=1 Tax=Bacillus sp. EB600 TaxID=2806345 RepID=UPI0021086739|nr:replication-relaxation family protein [Bacillus sp. EB600]